MTNYKKYKLGYEKNKLNVELEYMTRQSLDNVSYPAIFAILKSKPLMYKIESFLL